MNEIDQTPMRCRLVLIVDYQQIGPEQFEQALEGGDVGCVILYCGDSDNSSQTNLAEGLVKVAQSKDVAVLVANDTQTFGRTGADGLFLESGYEDLKDAIARFSPQKIVGCGKLKQKHRALEIGELQPDFVFFGKLEGDIKPDPHPKNLALANWWSELIEIPCIVMGGNILESVVDCADCGAEFVGLGKAVFATTNPKEAVRTANSLLDRSAPIFEEDVTQNS